MDDFRLPLIRGESEEKKVMGVIARGEAFNPGSDCPECGCPITLVPQMNWEDTDEYYCPNCGWSSDDEEDD